jgi:tetratricopeptide (TPR) repeat protein
MGDIFAATDSVLGREVVVKVLADRYAADEGIRERFKREGLAAARLSSQPGAITIFDVGEWNGRPFIVMEHLRGGSLEQRLQREGPQPPGRALAWLEQAATALDAAHAHGIVHRDVKPANLLLNERGELRVADFGIATAAGLESMTLTGTVLGTAGYLAPEQASGGRSGPASDRYALAVVAYELLSGHRPFERESATAEAAAHANAPVPSISERCKGLQPEVDAVFHRALAKEPRARYGSAREFVAELRDALYQGAGTTARFGPTAPAARRPSTMRFLVPAALLALAAATGAAIAALISSGGSPRQLVVTRTVTGPGGTTTIHERVTQQTTAAAPAPPPPPPPALGGGGHGLNDRGYSLVQQGNYAGAIPYLLRAVQALRGTGPSDPYEGYANYNLGYALYRLGRCQDAVRYLRKAQQLEPSRSEPGTVLRRAERC